MENGYYWWKPKKQGSTPEIVYVYGGEGEKPFQLMKRFHGPITSGQVLSLSKLAGDFISKAPLKPTS